MRITDTTSVRVLDGDTETWRGTLLQFETDNAFEDAACAEIRTSLAFFGSHVFNLGAGGLMAVALVNLPARLRTEIEEIYRSTEPRNQTPHDVANGRHVSAR